MMTDETEDDGLPAPSTFVRFLLGVAMRLLVLYVLAISVPLVPIIVYCATR
jgi:hypothetical protein